MLDFPRRFCQRLILTLPLAALAPMPAAAVTDDVRLACGGDYHAYCAQFAIGSTEVRTCMRTNRHRLTDRCRHALATSGDATPADVRRYERETGRRVSK